MSAVVASLKIKSSPLLYLEELKSWNLFQSVWVLPYLSLMAFKILMMSSMSELSFLVTTACAGLAPRLHSLYSPISENDWKDLVWYILPKTLPSKIRTPYSRLRPKIVTEDGGFPTFLSYQIRGFIAVVRGENLTLGKIESRRDLSTNVKTSFEPNFRRLENECGDRRRRENGVQIPEARRFHGNSYFGLCSVSYLSNWTNYTEFWSNHALKSFTIGCPCSGIAPWWDNFIDV